jgi:hypothetical protein
VAAKVEETFPADMRDYVWMSYNTVTSKELVNAELQILQTTDYNVTFPIMNDFIKNQTNNTVLATIIACVSPGVLSYLPSEIGNAITTQNTACWDVIISEFQSRNTKSRLFEGYHREIQQPPWTRILE